MFVNDFSSLYMYNDGCYRYIILNTSIKYDSIVCKIFCVRYFLMSLLFNSVIIIINLLFQTIVHTDIKNIQNTYYN